MFKEKQNSMILLRSMILFQLVKRRLDQIAKEIEDVNKLQPLGLGLGVAQALSRLVHIQRIQGRPGTAAKTEV
jgi:hypothetical protein